MSEAARQLWTMGLIILMIASTLLLLALVFILRMEFKYPRGQGWEETAEWKPDSKAPPPKTNLISRSENE